MTLAQATVVQAALADVVGEPVTLEVLKDKPGRRRTHRARGPGGSAIAKAYESERAEVVGARLSALADGPDEPIVPRVLRVDAGAHLVILSDVPGTPLSTAVRSLDLAACRRAGGAVGRWHRAWAGRAPAALRPHTVERELAILEERAAAAASPAIAAEVRRLAFTLRRPWPCPTVVHRDLYEEQILVGDRIGLIDLDDVALGPPELDVGNLLAHLALFAHRRGIGADAAIGATLAGYRTTGCHLNHRRLRQCELLSHIRLACIHAEPALLPGRRPIPVPPGFSMAAR